MWINYMIWFGGLFVIMEILWVFYLFDFVNMCRVFLCKLRIGFYIEDRIDWIVVFDWRYVGNF